MAGKSAADNTARLWVEEGEEKVGDVAVVAPLLPIDQSYAYAVPDELSGRLRPGQRVRVPFGRRGRPQTGFCVTVDRRPWNSTLRSVLSVVDPQPHLTPTLLALGRWIAAYYCCPLGPTLSSMVPDAVLRERGMRRVTTVRLLAEGRARAASPERLGPKQRAILAALVEAGRVLDADVLRRSVGASSGSLRSLAERGYVELVVERRPVEVPTVDVPRTEPDYELNAHQRDALRRVVRAVERRTFAVQLLYGVSGSGKTEVYIRAMQRVVESGRQALLLVPEIALTTQLVQRLASRLPDVAVIHSALTGVERSLTWRAVAAGEKKIVVGTRSAVFVPAPQLGLIVVDEEQETSFKNLQAPRFHVRDVAIKLAQLQSIPVVLGSATPSLETWHNCDRLAHFERIVIPQRVRDLPMPRVHVVDMGEECDDLGRMAVFSRLLERKLGETLANNGQAVLLMNRRGYASTVFCPRCKTRLRCPNCQVGLVYHAALDKALCHYCRTRIDVPATCPNASCAARLVRHGSGTQRVEECVRRRFPQARVVRADSDTMTHADRYRRLVDDFEARRIDVLVGTQMVAKGLDFPFVSFVGVVNADMALAAPDFRAGERLFQLITQVAGRAGREASTGEVVVQTCQPHIAALRAAVEHDYERFAAEELRMRRETGWPPFRRLTRIVVADAAEEIARVEAGRLADVLRRFAIELDLSGTDVLGPQPCIIPRLRGRYRYELLLRTLPGVDRRPILDRLTEYDRPRPRAKTITIDVDPVTMT